MQIFPTTKITIDFLLILVPPRVLKFVTDTAVKMHDDFRNQSQVQGEALR